MYIPIIIGLFCILIILYFFRSKKHIPKQYKHIEINNNLKKIHWNKDGFSMKKIPKDLDVIIIGSGIGGLVMAGLLSRVGKKVLVLEQHYIAGGSTHSYEDNGYEFDTGIHYIGNIEKRQKILNLIVDKPIKWEQLGKDDDYVYDNLIIRDKKYRIRAGYNNLINDLIKWFPEEEKAIRKYINLCKKVSKMDLHFMIKIVKPIFLAKIINYFYDKFFFKKYSQKNVKEMLDKTFKNNELKAVIGGLSIDGGPPPSKQSFYIHASILNHFAESAYYPVGGCSVFSNNIIEKLYKKGSRVLVRAPVSKIIIKNNRACGVIVKGKEIYANTIVTDIGIRNTYKKMIPQELPSSRYFDDVLDSISSNLSYNFVFLGMKKKSEDLDLKSNNIYMWPEISFDNSVIKYENEPFSGKYQPPIFISSNSAKDPKWNSRFPGKSVISAISWSNTNMFNTKGIPRKRKDELYTKNKDKVEKVLLEAIFKHFPKVKDNIDYKSTSTSESVKYYLGSYNGEVYGLDGTKNRFNYFKIRPKTNIKNLYLTGQDIVMVGFSAAVISAVLTTSEILGYGNILDIVTGRNIIDDISTIK